MALGKLEKTKYKGHIYYRYPHSPHSASRYFFRRAGTEFLHRRVYEDTFGTIPPNHHIHHKDADRSNNDPANLECIHQTLHLSMRKRPAKTIGAKRTHKKVYGILGSMKPIDKAIGLLGGKTALARAIGAKSHVNVWHWAKSGKVPAEWCAAIETATSGAVTRYDLRPDVFGEPPIKGGRSNDARRTRRLGEATRA